MAPRSLYLDQATRLRRLLFQLVPEEILQETCHTMLQDAKEKNYCVHSFTYFHILSMEVLPGERAEKSTAQYAPFCFRNASCRALEVTKLSHIDLPIDTFLNQCQLNL